MFWMKIVQGRDLPVADLNGFSDPYVEVKVLGHHRTIYRTQVVKRNLNPFWNEEFTYQPSSISEVLKLNCWDKDTFSRDDFLGYCTVPLQMYANRGLVDEWLPLLDKRGRRKRGDIHIQVTYQADQSAYPTNFAATSAPRSSPASSIFVAPPLTEEQMMREDPRFAFKRRLRMMQNPDEFARPDYPGSQPAMMPPAPEMPSLRELFGLSGTSRPPSGGRPLGVANPNYDPYPDFQPHPLSDITRREITPEDYDLLLTLDDNVSRASTNSSSPASSATPSASTSPTAATYSAPSAASMSRVNPTATPTTSYSSYSTSPTSASSYPSSSSYSTYNRTQNPMTYSTSPVHSSESTASSSTSTAATGATAPTASAAPNQCKICYDHTVDCVLIPCGHAGMCYDCANIQRSTNGNCPFCRAPINNVVKQFPV